MLFSFDNCKMGCGFRHRFSISDRERISSHQQRTALSNYHTADLYWVYHDLLSLYLVVQKGLQLCSFIISTSCIQVEFRSTHLRLVSPQCHILSLSVYETKPSLDLYTNKGVVPPINILFNWIRGWHSIPTLVEPVWIASGCVYT